MAKNKNQSGEEGEKVSKESPFVSFVKKSRSNAKNITWTNRRVWISIAGTAIVAFGGGILLNPVFAPVIGLPTALTASNATADEMLSGRVALTEDELFHQVQLHNLVAYWIGPRAGYKYTLNVTVDSQVYIRYLPSGASVGSPDSDFVVIGTYPQKDAFDITAAAGSQENSVNFVNGDGAQVFYNKLLMSNVYLAFPDEDYEVEIYSPVSGDSVLYATTPGQVSLIN